MEIEYLGGPQVAFLALTNDEILNAVETGLIAAGRGQTMIEPRMHLAPDPKIQRPFQRSAWLC